MKKLIKTFALFLFFSVISANVYAVNNCYYVNGYSDKKIDLDLGKITVQRDVPVGTVVYTKTVTFYPDGTNVWNCADASRIWYYSSADTNSVITPNYYNLNVPGYAVRVYSGLGVTSSYIYSTPDLAQPNSDGSSAKITIIGGVGSMTMQIIKTSNNATSGPVLRGYYAKFYAGKQGGGNIYPMMLNVVGGNIETLACSINTPNLTFPLGDIPVTSFGNAVGITPANAQNTQNLGLNCNAGANINVTLTGLQNPDVGNTSVLALTSQGEPSVAKGVGVQIIYNGSPLLLNNRIVLKQSAGGQEMFPLTARYYQTRTAVTTGKANASATLNLTYQ